VPFDSSALNFPTNAGSGSTIGANVDTDSLMGITTFFRGVELIADSIALLPLQAIEKKSDGARVPMDIKPGVVTDPFLGVSLQEGVSQILTSLIIRGNAYLFPGKVVDNQVVQWRIVSPDVVHVRWNPDGSERIYKIGGKDYPGPVTHLTGFMLPGAPIGMGVLEKCRNEFGLTTALTDSATTLFSNGVMASGVISVDAALTPEMAKATAESFKQNHAGVGKAHLPIVLGGGAKWQQLSLSPEDSQFLQSRQFQQGLIATVLGIPPHLLGIVDRTTSWGSGIEVQGRAFVDYTLRPYIQRLQTMFTKWLPAGTWAEYDTDAITRAETQTRFANWKTAVEFGLMNVDEARSREGLPPLPDGLGETYYYSIQSNPLGIAAPAPVPTENPNTDQAATPATTTGAS
jgi:HK97 family phage portal protein